jgi:hypothetical protein
MDIFFAFHFQSQNIYPFRFWEEELLANMNDGDGDG